MIVSADMAAMTLACVELLDDPVIADVAVVDNAFDPAAGERRAEIAARARVLELDRRLGFAAANNRAIAGGGAPYVLLLNSDILVEPGAVARLVRVLREQPGAVAVGGRLGDLLDARIGHARAVVAARDRVARPRLLDAEHDHQEVAQPAAAALMVVRAELEAVGGLDERFWFWFEDSDLLLRLSRRGRVLYAPDAVFRHLGGGTFGRWSKSELIRSAHHGMLHYGDAHLGRLARFALGLAALAVSTPRIVLFARTRPQEAAAWRAVAAGGAALVRGRGVPAIAPGP